MWHEQFNCGYCSGNLRLQLRLCFWVMRSLALYENRTKQEIVLQFIMYLMCARSSWSCLFLQYTFRATRISAALVSLFLFSVFKIVTDENPGSQCRTDGASVSELHRGTQLCMQRCGDTRWTGQFSSLPRGFWKLPCNSNSVVGVSVYSELIPDGKERENGNGDSVKNCSRPITGSRLQVWKTLLCSKWR